VAPIFTALAMGFVAAITVLIGEVIIKHVFSKLSFCPFGVKKECMVNQPLNLQGGPKCTYQV
jgi:hypothetical protein